MSGHSKWSTIRHKKAAQDKKRGDVFTKMAKMITIAVKSGGGGDPDTNFSLRLAMDKARSVNMPKDNIQRAIDRGLGKGSEGSLEEMTLEGYAPGGVPVIVEAVTDNRQRTVAEVKNIFDKAGGSMAGPGAVMYQFERVGIIGYSGEITDEVYLELIDKGVLDIDRDDDGGLIYCMVDSVQTVKEYLSTQGFQELEVEIGYRPSTKTDQKVDKEDGISKLLDILREHDDVQEVYSTIEEA